jgi:outer membrane protein OmpA-like peptidoglycan-associated protein
MSPGSFADTHDRPALFGGRLGYQSSEEWSFGAQVAQMASDATVPTASEVDFTPVTVWAQRDFVWTRLWTPYVVGGVGFSRNSGGAPADSSRTGWTASVGAGLTFRLSDMQDLSVEAGVQQVADGSEQGQDVRLWTANGEPEVYSCRKVGFPWNPMWKFPTRIWKSRWSQTNPNRKSWTRPFWPKKRLTDCKRRSTPNGFPAITFDTASAIVQATSFRSLDALGTILRRYPDAKIRIHGYADESTPAADRDPLALARAQVVGTYLTQNFYINENRLVFLGEPTPPPLRMVFETLPTR